MYVRCTARRRAGAAAAASIAPPGAAGQLHCMLRGGGVASRHRARRRAGRGKAPGGQLSTPSVTRGGTCGSRTRVPPQRTSAVAGSPLHPLFTVPSHPSARHTATAHYTAALLLPLPATL